MKTHRLFPTLLLFACAVPLHGQVRRQAQFDSLLRGASDALDRYEQLAPGIHCEDATEKALRDSCKTVLETLGSDVREAKEGIARCRELSTPSRADLFDIYQMFQKIMAEVGELGYAGELYGEHNRELFAKVWNNFVKFTGWFGAEVRAGPPDTEKVCECGDN
jgi:hypothetical protein